MISLGLSALVWIGCVATSGPRNGRVPRATTYSSNLAHPCPLFSRNVALISREPIDERGLCSEGEDHESAHIVMAGAVGQDHHVFGDLISLDEHFELAAIE
jgi:hypothetical protein